MLRVHRLWRESKNKYVNRNYIALSSCEKATSNTEMKFTFTEFSFSGVGRLHHYFKKILL